MWQRRTPLWICNHVRPALMREHRAGWCCIFARGLCVVRSTNPGNAKASNCGAGNRYRPCAFLFPTLQAKERGPAAQIFLMTYTFGQTHPRRIDPETFDSNILVLNISQSLDDYRERCNLQEDFQFNPAHIMSFTQRAWRLSETHADEADVILSVVNIPEFGKLILGAFVFDRPDKKEKEKFIHLHQDEEGRYSFLAEPAPPHIWNKYVGNYLPAPLRGEANPVRYHFKDSE